MATHATLQAPVKDHRALRFLTAGSVDDASVAGDVVHGAKGASTTTADSGVADFEINRPFIEDRVSIIS